ncbi:MAG: CHAD domain-containing protein, partial [Elusimicrobia bacterium]|nr:CHAD domain-containing protein [Elusimicrobiota bacterium]
MSDELLRQPAREAARNLMRRLLNHAAAAARRLTSDDPEAIHDFRVALRRLRANVDSFRELLENAASKKIRRRLRRLARDTNASRDAEAGLALLSSVTVPAAGRA